MIIIDAHNDTLDMRLEHGGTLDLTQDTPQLDTDLKRLKAGGITAMFQQVGIKSLKQSLRLLDAANKWCTDYPQHFHWISTAKDVHLAKKTGQIGIVGQIESLSCLEGELFLLRTMHSLGVRVAGLTHGEAPEWGLQADKSPTGGCSCADREAARRIFKGLTSLGREAITELNRMHILIDLAHANDATFWQAIELSDAPVIVSHGNAFAKCNQWRNLTDDQIRALAQKSGVMGVAFYRRFIADEGASVEKLADHVEHIVNLVGIEHVGFGADWDGLGVGEVAIPKDPAHLWELQEALEKRGFGGSEIEAFMGGNWLRVFESVVG